ncbi:hypothetical protein MASR2M12_08790 [Bacteroidales bacterium]
MPTKIKLRQKKISNGRESLYFDIYPPIFNPVTGIESRREFLNLYIYSNPQTKEQADHNLNTFQTANEVLQEKQTLLEQGKYEFTPEQPVKVSFKEIERKNSDKDFLIDLLQQVRNIEKQILNQLQN